MTGAWLVWALCLAGGLGAASRMALDGIVKARVQLAYPVGTTLVNATGSFLIGITTGLAATALLPAPWSLIAGTGFLGGYTTFSTASFETVRLAQQGRWRAATLNAFGMLLLCLLAAALGLWLGRLVS